MIEHGAHCHDNACSDEAQTIACAHGRIDFMHEFLMTRMVPDMGQMARDTNYLLKRIQRVEKVLKLDPPPRDDA